MNKIKKIAVINEFENYINFKYNVVKEIEYRCFMETNRRFRCDYLLNEEIIVEINGGQWIYGRHNRGGKGYENDLTKMNIAQSNGFKYYQFTYEMLLRMEYNHYL